MGIEGVSGTAVCSGSVKFCTREEYWIYTTVVGLDLCCGVG